MLVRHFVAASALVLALACRALPSTLDTVAQVSQTSYSNFLNNDLYAHDGFNRLNSTQHDLARTNIFNDFLAMGLTPSLDSFTYSGSTYYNVYAILAGLNNPGDIYVVGAHYDSVAGPGADDNASGVAGVLEAARVLSQHSFNGTLVFIAFDREEQGLIGSAAYVANHPGNIKGMISLDMIAHNGDPGHDVAAIYGASASAPIRGDLANAVTQYSGGLTPDDRGAALDCCSDQRSFENAGYQGALLIEGSSNPYYHTTSDSLDNAGYIDYQFATRMTRSAVGYLADNAGEVPEPATALTAAVAILILVAARRRSGKVS